MEIESFPPSCINWTNLSSEKILGESGFSISRKQSVGKINTRLIEYSSNYLADHWCEKGHILFVIDGELILEHPNNFNQVIKKGMAYIVGDNSMPHRAKSIVGAKIFIID
jgi:hypothetical protein